MGSTGWYIFYVSLYLATISFKNTAISYKPWQRCNGADTMEDW